MNDMAVQVGWSDAQWSRVAQVVTEEVNKSSIRAAIPCYGPAPDGMDIVRWETVTLRQLADIPSRLEVVVEDTDTVPMWTLEVYVRLRHEQISDESLSSALLAFRRAANLLSIVQDAIVLHGDPRLAAQLPIARANNPPVRPLAVELGPKALLVRQIASPEQGIDARGLVHQGAGNNPTLRQTGISGRRTRGRTPRGAAGNSLVSGVEQAIRQLDKNRHSGPFACVLGNDAFIAVHEATQQAPVLRSGSLAPGLALVVATSAESFDLVVGTPPEVQFLQVTPNEEYVFRVYERVVLRIKDPTALFTIVM